MPAANPRKGEADFRGRKLVVNFNALCALERVTGRTVPQLVGRMEVGLSFDDVRVWLRVLIEDKLTDDEVGEIIGDLAGYEEALGAIASAFEGFFPPPKVEADEDSENPRKAA